jgi:uncharacterized protein
MSLRKKIFTFSAVVLAGIAVISCVYILRVKKTAEVCFEGNCCFFVEIAKTPAGQEKGLMFQKSLPANQGMLFVFAQEGIYNFWMKNTLIPLDMVWINENNEVVFIKNNAQPCSDNFCPQIAPGRAAKYVLEINAGKAQEAKIFIGQKVSISE